MKVWKSRLIEQVFTKMPCTYDAVLCFMSSLEYLKQIAGPRTVPVELGSCYTDSVWAQKLMTFSEFIDTHIVIKVSNNPLIVLLVHI